MIQEPILLVDDEPELRNSLREALQSDGYTVEEADGYTQALEQVARTHFPVIVTDLNMPLGKSGLELIEAVKARDPKALCIVITGYATLGASIEAIKRGAYDFLQKPFKLEELEAVLDRALEHARLQRRLEAYQADLESRVVARVAEMKAFHEEVLCLNGLLRDALGETQESVMLPPFLDYLKARFAPDSLAFYLPDAVGAWSFAQSWGASVPPPRELPAPEHFLEATDWAGTRGDGHLVPLRHAQRTLGAIYLEFASRSSFSPEDSVFELWCHQVVAALHALHRTRAFAAAQAAKRV